MQWSVLAPGITNLAAFKFVIPSKCTVFIQKSLLVDWFGLTDTVEFAVVAPVVPLLP